MAARSGWWLAVLCAQALTLACGGGGGGGSTVQTATAAGAVTLPAGSTLAPASLTVASVMGQVGVAADGTFAAREPLGGGRAMVFLKTAAGKVVLVGRVDTDDPSANEVSSRSTAEELLFYATGSSHLPRAEWPNVYRLLAAAPETATLAGVIATRVAANPTALDDQDGAIAAAVTVAASSLVGGAAASGRAPGAVARQLSTAEIVVSRPAVQAAASQPVLSIGVDPGDASDLTVGPSTDGLGIFISNTARIHRAYLIYRTGYVPAGGKLSDAPTALPTWTLVQAGYLSATTGVTGVVSALIDYFNRKVAYGPVATPTIPLTLVPADARANVYRIFVVGAGVPGAPPSDLTYQPAALAAVKAARAEMIGLEVAKELVWPIISKSLPKPSSEVLTPEKAKTLVQLFNQLMKDLGSVEVNYAAQLEKGDLLPAYFDLVKAALSDDSVKTALRKMCSGMVAAMLDFHMPDSVYGTVEDSLRVFGNCLKGLDVGATVIDEFSIAWFLAHSADYNAWSGRAAAAEITLTPTTATITSPSQTATFSVTVTGYASSSLTYQWGPAAYGRFTACGKPAADLVTCPGQQVAVYALAGTTLPSQDETVALEVFDPHGASLGKAKATVYFSPHCGTLALAAGNVCCEDLTQGAACCGKTARHTALVCCADGTQGLGCCGGTALRYGNACCSDGSQRPDCNANPWVGTWSGPVWNNCQNPFQSGLQYTISAVSDTLLLVDYVYGAGNGSAYATYSGSTATGSNTTLTLDAGATPPTITILNTVACMHGVLTKR